MTALRYRGWWQAGGWLLAVLVFSTALAPDKGNPDPLVSDKVVHFASFLLLSVWFAGAFARQRYVAVIAALLVLAAGIEVVQYLLGHRSAELADFVADGLGIAAGFALALAGLGHWCHWVERRILRVA